MRYSRAATRFLIILFVLVAANKHAIFQGNTQIIEWDGYGYYAYLPAIFIYGLEDNFEFVDQHFADYEISSEVYQVRPADNGQLFPIYNIGLALLWLPFFLLAHLYCLLFGGFEPDGMSLPYQLSIWTAAMFYLALGWRFLARFLRQHLSDKATAATLLLVGLGTNLFYYGYNELELTHLYLFSAYAAFLYYFQRFLHQKQSLKALIIPGLIAGLLVLIRSSEIVVFPLAALWAWDWRWNSLRRNFRHTAILLGLAIPVFCLQLLFYKMSVGDWWVNGYGGHHFDWWKPHFYECFIGFRRGWLIYTPMAIFMLLGIGFLYRHRPKWFWSVLAFTIANCWIVFSWHIWWYGSTFGSRPVVQSYAVLALPLGVFGHWLWKRTKGRSLFRAFICTSAGLIILLNLFQSWQFEKRIIPLDHNNSTHYWHNFFATQLDRHSYRFLDTNEKLGGTSIASYNWKRIAQIDSTIVIPGQGPGYQEYFNFYQENLDAASAEQFSERWSQIRLDLSYLGRNYNDWFNPLLVFEVRRGEESLKWTSIRIPQVINKLARDTIVVDIQLPPLEEGDLWQIYQWNQTKDSVQVNSFDLFTL